MGYIDCDSHAIETEATWSHLRDHERTYRPRTIEVADPNAPDAIAATFWLAGDSWCRRAPTDANVLGNANRYAPGLTDLTAVDRRIDDLDALGIDVQLVHPTFFITMELSHRDEEVAIARSYNRWLAERLGPHQDRFRWTARVPLQDAAEAEREMVFAKEHGAAGIFLRGIEHGLYLNDPMFLPILATAHELDLAIVVHFGTAKRREWNAPIGRSLHTIPAIAQSVAPLMAGLFAVLASDFDQQFPGLRFAFLEGGASWVPSVLQQFARLKASGTDFLAIRPVGAEELVRKNVFVSCESDEDLGYLVQVLGEDVLVAGTDYGHNDVGTELAAHDAIRFGAALSDSATRKLLVDNGARLLGLPTVPALPDRTGVVNDLPNVRGASTPDGRPILHATVVA